MWIALAFCALVPWAGCRKDQLPLAPVRGTVTVNGKPLAGAIVNFLPVGTTRGQGGAGITDQEGRYELKTRGVHRGIVAGEYRVACQKLPKSANPNAVSNVSATAPPTQFLPEQYGDMDKSTLKATVPAEGGIIDFNLTLPRQGSF